MSGKNDRFTHVVTDYETGTYHATDYLIKAGLKNIKLLLDYQNWPSHYEKIKGFKKAYLDNHIPFHSEQIVWRLYSSEDVFHFVEENLKVIRYRMD